MSGKIEGKVIVFVSDAVRGGGNDSTPGTLLRFLAAGLPVPPGWERVVLEPAKEPSRVMENFGHIGRCPARLSRHAECFCERLQGPKSSEDPLAGLAAAMEQHSRMEGLKEVWVGMSQVERSKFVDWAKAYPRGDEM
jgi:hypothetical protein